MKKCASCKVVKETTFFHKKAKSTDGLHSYCKACVRLKNREWVILNKERHAATCAAWYSKNRDKAIAKGTDWHYKTKYGITHAEFIQMVQDINYICPICSTTLTVNGIKSKQQAVLDHDHSSGKIRGIICSNCNVGLGVFKDNLEVLTKAQEYLRSKS